MVNKPFIYSLGAIALIVLVVGLFAIGNKGVAMKNADITGQASLAPSTGGTGGAGSGTSGATTTKIVNANECRADNMCEANILQATKVEVGQGSIKVVTNPSGIDLNGPAQSGGGVSNSIRFMNLDNGNPVDTWSIGLNPQTVYGTPFKQYFYIRELYGGGLITRLVIEESSGNVGIGTDDPSEKLEVSGTISSVNLKIQGMSGSGNAYACVDPTGNIFRSQTPCAGSGQGGTTNQAVLDMLNQCSVNSQMSSNGNLNGNQLCEQSGATCIGAYFSEVGYNETLTWDIRTGCTDTWQGGSNMFYIQAVCCEP